MEVLRITTVAFLLLVIILSGLLCSIIYRYISNKPPVQTTIIDLIYKDCIVLIFAITVFMSITFMCSQFSDDFTLSYPLALALTNIVYTGVEFGSICMAISSFLRLLTILKHSEEAGIQLFGTDDQALRLIRTVAAFSSVAIILAANLVFETVPPAVNFLTEFQNLSASEVFKKSTNAYIYIVFPCLAVALNLLAYLVSKNVF
jgi:hypothetical protein